MAKTSSPGTHRTEPGGDLPGRSALPRTLVDVPVDEPPVHDEAAPYSGFPEPAGLLAVGPSTHPVALDAELSPDDPVILPLTGMPPRALRAIAAGSLAVVVLAVGSLLGLRAFRPAGGSSAAPAAAAVERLVADSPAAPPPARAPAETAPLPAAPRAAAARSPSSAPPYDHFDRLSGEASLSAAAQAASFCDPAGQHRGAIEVRVTFDPSGEASNAVVLDDRLAATPVGDCVAKRMSEASAHPFRGGSVALTRVVHLR